MRYPNLMSVNLDIILIILYRHLYSSANLNKVLNKTTEIKLSLKRNNRKKIVKTMLTSQLINYILLKKE